MVKLNKIYTKTGDDGWTGLVDGTRRLKDDLRVEAYGTVDETNAAIGMVRLHTVAQGSLDAMLARIQHDLFDLGADLATPESRQQPAGTALRICAGQVKRLEDEIDTMNAQLAALTSFVLPGGTAAAACLHLARTVARRAERKMVALHQREPVNPCAMHYINRLSDFLFVAARFVNNKGQKDIMWVPGATRP